MDVLAKPDTESLPALSKPIVLATIDKATEQTLDELDQLIDSIRRLREAIIRNSEFAKQQIEVHFMLGAEAIGFRDMVHNKLAAITHPTEENDK